MMKAKVLLGVVALCVVTAVMVVPASSQDDAAPGAKPPTAEEMKAMMEGMKAWKEAMKPSKHHQALAHFVGEWNTTSKMWYMPGSPAVITKGTSKVEWKLGKRFIVETHSGEMMMPDMTGGMNKVPHNGIATLGYDNHRNMYEGSWISDLGTNTLTYKGSADPSGKTFRFYGEMDEAMIGVIGRYVKYETKIVNDNKHVFSIYDLHAKDAYKVIEITYERK